MRLKRLMSRRSTKQTLVTIRNLMSWMEVKTYFHQQFSKSIVRILKKMQHESATFAQERSILIVA